jgi:hypothetical protein
MARRNMSQAELARTMRTSRTVIHRTAALAELSACSISVELSPEFTGALFPPWDSLCASAREGWR